MLNASRLGVTVDQALFITMLNVFSRYIDINYTSRLMPLTAVKSIKQQMGKNICTLNTRVK